METLDDRNAALKVAVALAHRLRLRSNEPCGAEKVRAAGEFTKVAFQTGLQTGQRLGWIAIVGNGDVALTEAGFSAAGLAIVWPSIARLTALGLKGPAGEGFKPEEWRALVAGGNADIDDQRLVATAEWLGAEAKALKVLYPMPPNAPGGQGHATMLAVAAANRDFANARSKGDPGDGERDFARNFLNQPISMNDYVDALGDTLESWLLAASRLGRHPGLGSWPRGLDATASQNTKRYSILHANFDFAQQSLWENWYLENGQGDLAWTPADVAFSKLTFAWNVRTRSSTGSNKSLIANEWAASTEQERRLLDLPRTVTGVKKDKRGGWLIEHGPPQITDNPPLHLIWTRILEDSYLVDFMDEPLPKHPELTCRLLLQAWSVLEALADHAAQFQPSPHFRNGSDVRTWALAFPRAKLMDILRRTLGDTFPAAAAVAFLSWGPKAYKGLWGKPLVPVPGDGAVCLARSILTASYAPRRAEIWLEDGGFSDGMKGKGRGDVYEEQVRLLMRDTIAANPLLDDTRSAAYGISQSKNFSEQIDLVLQIGDLLVVGEVKCFLFPADSRERYRHMRKLNEACDQAWRKAHSLSLRPDVTASVLGISEARAATLRPMPLVVLNLGFGLACEIGGCRIADAKLLHLFLSNDARGDDPAATKPASYADQAGAAAAFEAMLADPPSLRKAIDRQKPAQYDTPTSSSGNLKVTYFAPG